MAVRRLCGGGRLYGVGLIDLTLEVTLPASLALLVLSSLSWRMPAGAEERAALSTRACTHLRSSVERQAYSHVKAGTCVSSRVRRSRIITWLKGRHALHDLLVIDQHADRCALAACHPPVTRPSRIGYGRPLTTMPSSTWYRCTGYR